MSNLLICLVHWDETAREERVRSLRKSGFNVISDLPGGTKFLRMLEDREPEALIIDLTRIPSQGRDLGVAVRKRKGTRFIPLVFVGGDPEKVENIQKLLPDAYFSGWGAIESAIQTAIESETDDLVVPDSVFAAYAGKPLAEKLGIKSDCKLLPVDSPKDFLSILGDLPENVSIAAAPDNETDLVIWFVRSFENLQLNLGGIVDASKRSPVWIAWPKKSSNLESDLTQTKVRKACMNAGMVDYKICSVDHTWSALLFTYRG